MTVTPSKPKDTPSSFPDEQLPSWMFRREVFIFDYGVIVFWNFSLEEEVRYIEGLNSCATGALSNDNVEIENLHFQ